MEKRLGWSGLVVFLGIAAAWTASGVGAGELPIDRGVGQRVAGFTLNDTAGNAVSLYGFAGKRAAVLVFLGVDCPLANLYVPRLIELNAQYRKQGVVFLAINSNAHESAEEVAKHAREHGIDFPVLKDVGNRVADQLLVERTCEALVLDGRAILRYRGEIDDQYVPGNRRPLASRNSLRDALEAVLAGKPVSVPATSAAGCLVDRAALVTSGSGNERPRVRAASPEIVKALRESGKGEVPAVGSVTFSGGIAVILQEKCQSCHRRGQVAPFALGSYDEARRHAAMIREVVDERRMPPWHADPRYGHFRNDRSLSAEQRAALLAWVDQGTPLGDPAAVPPARAFAEDWSIGTPDVVFELPKPYVVPAQGVIDYVKIRIPTHFQEDRWIQAAEAQPGERSVVHHILVQVDDHKPKGERQAEGFFCAFAPGDVPAVYADGIAKKIPAGADLVLQMHYTPDGTVRADRSRVGLIFAKAPVSHEAHTRPIAQPRFTIPAGAADYPVRASLVVPRDIRVLSFMPHMHLRGKSFAYRATYPDGTTETLLSVPAYDFGWQSYYTLAEAKRLPRGTRIDCEAHYDNSAANPANPDPAKAVRWGDQTFDEMMIGYFDYIDEEPVAKTEAKRVIRSGPAE